MLSGVSLSVTPGCSRKTPAAANATPPPRHEHHPPHGGTPVVLGNEAYHLELVLDSGLGMLQAYVLDGEMENFIRCTASAVEIDATIGARRKTLVLTAVANPATGETMGDTALFEGRAGWLKTSTTFDGVLEKITIRGTTFTDVKFNFPKGNDRD